MTGLTRWYAIVAVIALVVGVVSHPGPQRAIAQQSPGFPPGEWLGNVWFSFETGGENSFIQHTGDGELRVQVSSNEGGSGTVGGTLAFDVQVAAFSAIATSERDHTADWVIQGYGPNVPAEGPVIVHGVDSALFEETGEFIPVEINFLTESRGTLTISTASCASVNGTFSTELISPPGGILGVAFTGPFSAIPGGNDLIEEQWDNIHEAVKVPREILRDLNASPDGVNAQSMWDSGLSDELWKLVGEVEKLNQIIADSGLCGKVTGTYARGGVKHQLIADMMLAILEAVAKSIEIFSPEEIVSYYTIAASSGAFSLPEFAERSAYVQAQIPLGLRYHVDTAKENGDTESLKLLHTAACQFGWTEIKKNTAP